MNVPKRSMIVITSCSCILPSSISTYKRSHCNLELFSSPYHYPAMLTLPSVYRRCVILEIISYIKKETPPLNSWQTLLSNINVLIYHRQVVALANGWSSVSFISWEEIIYTFLRFFRRNQLNRFSIFITGENPLKRFRHSIVLLFQLIIKSLEAFIIVLSQ